MQKTQVEGFRLNRLEVLNWGTFDHEVWQILPNGSNSLLTGDIGSGKSTLVDALTTLLVPPQKITFNRAAGAETRERNLRSYVKGAFKNEKVEDSGKARDVYLRDGQSHYTVIAAQFENIQLNQTHTLAQILWMQNDQVRKFFVLAAIGLQILPDFSKFGADIKNLRKRLKNNEKIELFDSFSDYSNRFRQVFGIQQPEALELFYQTISMKSVGNLTDFIRERMLGRTNIQQNIDDLVARYQELTEAHKAVQIAKEQYELLQPLIQDTQKRQTLLQRIQELYELLDELPQFFAGKRLHVLQTQLELLYADWEKNEDHHTSLQLQLTNKGGDLTQLKIMEAGLDVNQRLQSLKMQIKYLEKEKNKQKAIAQNYGELLNQLNQQHDNAWQTISSSEAFLEQRQQVKESLELIEAQLQAVSRSKPAVHIQINDCEKALDLLDQELDSLKKRLTNIPDRNLRLRQTLLKELRIEATDLPFVGELLQVKEEEREWEGAIERQLHSFGLSLLVEDKLYQDISKIVDQRHLKGKLVYLRTLPHRKPFDYKPNEKVLARKIRIKGDTPFYNWLEHELFLYHNLTCCDSMEEFYRVERGITKKGLIKSGRIRHSKDDRFNINDRSRYILGWSNKEKIKVLEKRRAKELTLLEQARNEERHLLKMQKRYDSHRSLLKELLSFRSFSDMDFQTTAARLQELIDERNQLENESVELKELQTQIRELNALVHDLTHKKEKAIEKRGALSNEVLRCTNQMYRLLDHFEVAKPSLQEKDLSQDITYLYNTFTQIQLPEVQASVSLQKRLNKLRSADTAQAPNWQDIASSIRETISGNRGSITRRREELNAIEKSILLKMQAFRSRYPEEAREIDASIIAIPAFQQLYERLVADDIPRHEARFRELLKQGAIRGILSFKTKLEDYEHEIKEKINTINRQLREINYNEGTYISIVSELVRSEDIVAFKQDLKACLSNIYGEENDIYNEDKFRQVQKLLDRFKGDSEANSRWTRRVTDVRQWYTFGADERYVEDDESKEYYSDSSGKSGGQKEKLAYTILASAIAFQFGLEWGRKRERSFRFVVIDEAFGRGSNESTRYGLELFKRLNLQLLIVTPLQKINVIEDYIDNVHYVSNPSGKKSMVRNISKAAYLEEKQRFLDKSTQLQK